MPNKFEPYQSLVNDFNAKYGLNFSYEAFETNVRRSRYMDENFVSEKGDPNDREYVNKFGPLYRQALTNFADRKIDSFNSEEMIRDYRKMMGGYRKAMNQEGANITGWPKDMYLVEHAQNAVKNIPNSKEEYITQRYLAGTLPMRALRAHVAQITENARYADPEKLSTVLGYANALSEINRQRPRWWRIIHPFRNAAEQREAKNFKQAVTSRVGIFKSSSDPKEFLRPVVGVTGQTSNLTDGYYLARSIVRDNSIGDAKADLDKLEERFNNPVQESRVKKRRITTTKSP